MSGNGTAVGKRLGVQPTIARRAAAAGRNGKRLTTGEQANVRAIVGKGAVADALSRMAKPGKARKLKAVAEAPAVPHPRLPSGKPPIGSSGQITYRQSRLQGYVNKAAPGTNGMGQLVPQFRGAALKSLVPQAPAFAPKQPKANNTLVAAGGTKPSTAGLSGVGTASGGSSTASGGVGGSAGGVGKASLGVLDSGMKGLKAGLGGWRDSARAIGMGRGARTANTVGRRTGQGLGLVAANPGAAAVGAGAGGLAVYGSRKAVGKRRYDPEDERRHRQGALAATAALGGADLVYSGGKEIARDTKQMRGAPAALKPGHPPARETGPWRGVRGGMRTPTPQERLGEDMAYDINRKLHAQKLEAWHRLASPKGAQVTARAGGKVGAGLALVGGGVALHRRRREPRYD